jgi:hypothetical protein
VRRLLAIALGTGALVVPAVALHGAGEIALVVGVGERHGLIAVALADTDNQSDLASAVERHGLIAVAIRGREGRKPALLRRPRRQMKAAGRRARRREQGASDVKIPAALEAIAQCESHGNPRAIGGGGSFRGKYQFDMGTWAAVGGKGDPAAAPEAEQDRRAAMLYARSGSSPWPVCG